MAHPSGWDIKYTFSLYYSSCINAVPVAIPSPAKHPHFAKRVCCTTYAGCAPAPASSSAPSLWKLNSPAEIISPILVFWPRHRNPWWQRDPLCFPAAATIDP